MDTNVDTLLDAVGDFGVYQKIMFALLCIPACISGGWTAFSHVFIVASPRHVCKSWFSDVLSCYQQPVGRNESLWNDTIGLTACEYDLVCERSEWPAMIGMAYYAGSFCGNILFGLIADKYGRKKCLLTILLNHIISNVASIFAPNVYVYAALRFLVGATHDAFYGIPFILSKQHRESMRKFDSGARIMADYLPMRLHAMAICFLTTYVLNSNLRLLPESPRWLITCGKSAEAAKLLTKIAGNVDTTGKPVKWRFSDCFQLFRRPNMRIKTLLITYIWFMNDLVYSGMMYNIPNLQLDNYLTFSLNGLVEIPAYFVSWALVNRLGRRKPLCAMLTLTAVACFIAICLPEGYTWTVMHGVLAVLARFFVSISFATICVFFNELYPTSLRGIGMGLTTMVTSVGMIFAPYMVHYHRILPLLLMGLFSASASILAPILPETAHIELPQTVEDAEHLPVKCYICTTTGRREQMQQFTDQKPTA
ncbi:unnamed protein product [Soboliphyme baturini]|uniref:MFS domain-containing protein n=1 Tax=Soboliphyme baturini TaxID=241478 RepID=A0A183IPL8_9BILA|nr:unnamed protein product [Soboliphyme baturini]